jgi:hypothetical protein
MARNMKSMQDELRTHGTMMEENKVEIQARIDARMDANMESMRDKRMKANKDTQEETMACKGKTEACLGKEQPASKEMKPEVAHEEAPCEDAARMLVGQPRKRRRDRRHLAAVRRQKEQDRNLAARHCRKEQKWAQRKIGCRRNLVAARRGTTQDFRKKDLLSQSILVSCLGAEFRYPDFSFLQPVQAKAGIVQ